MYLYFFLTNLYETVLFRHMLNIYTNGDEKKKISDSINVTNYFRLMTIVYVSYYKL